MDVQSLLLSGTFSQIDRQFSQFIARCTPQQNEMVQLAAALVSRATAQGNVCLALDEVVRIDTAAADGDDGMVHQIDPSGWVAELRRSAVVGQPGDYRPMILDGSRLYLQRYWAYEQTVAQAIRRRCRSVATKEKTIRLKSELLQVFPEGDHGQQQAILSALTQGFTVVSGGPGTGKTYTLAKLILIMHQLDPSAGLRIKLAAPTGKAVMRLQQSIERAMRAMGHHLGDPPFGPENIQTLHRLLGAREGPSGFTHHPDNQLLVDMVMVDEASMIDLALMAALMGAMPDDARLVLIGDKNQLASVEAGAVLGDICMGVDDQHAPSMQQDAAGTRDGVLEDRIVLLTNGYRFGKQSGIDALAAAVHAGDFHEAEHLLNKKTCRDVSFKSIKDTQALQSALHSLAMENMAPSFEKNDPVEMMARLEGLVILSPLRNGPWGINTLNPWVEQVLIKHGSIKPWDAGREGWYPGRPVMVEQNDYHHHLFNGDLGVVAHTNGNVNASLTVYFSDNAGGYKTVPVQQLPAHQTAYAMTVHKSQGSEFDRVVLVLPQRETPLLTRELIYTAITRARGSVEIWGTRQSLKMAIRQRIKRTSGLGPLLWPSGKKESD